MSTVAVLPVDPTLPTVTVQTSAGPVVLCCDFATLMDGEAALIAAGHDVNLLLSLQVPFTASGLRTFFAIASRRFQPKLEYEAALKLFTLQTAPQIAEAITKVWELSSPAPQESGESVVADPPAPSAGSGESNTGSGSSQPPADASASDSTSSVG